MPRMAALLDFLHNALGFTLVADVLAPLLQGGKSATHADEWNLMTRFTVNHPFEVPGMTLQPNTRYVIRLYDSPSTRNVVQVLNDDETKLLTMFMAVSDQRLEPFDKTVFTFIETQPGYPLPDSSLRQIRQDGWHQRD